MEKDIENCLKVLEAGGIILYPTDTVWGLGCDATNPDAVAALYALKRRRDSKSMLSLVDSRESLLRWVGELPENAEATLAEAILAEPGRPTTVIYPSPRGLAPGLIAEDGSAGFRISGEAFTRELCRRFGRPVVSTSANISGEPRQHASRKSLLKYSGPWTTPSTTAAMTWRKNPQAGF